MTTHKFNTLADLLACADKVVEWMVYMFPHVPESDLRAAALDYILKTSFIKEMPGEKEKQA